MSSQLPVSSVPTFSTSITVPDTGEDYLEAVPRAFGQELLDNTAYIKNILDQLPVTTKWNLDRSVQPDADLSTEFLNFCFQKSNFNTTNAVLRGYIPVPKYHKLLYFRIGCRIPDQTLALAGGFSTIVYKNGSAIGTSTGPTAASTVSAWHTLQTSVSDGASGSTEFYDVYSFQVGFASLSAMAPIQFSMPEMDIVKVA